MLTPLNLTLILSIKHKQEARLLSLALPAASFLMAVCLNIYVLNVLNLAKIYQETNFDPCQE